MAKAKFITFEGGEGAGKSTQIGLLAAALRAAGVDVLETREPGGSPGAEEIRELLVHGAPDRWDPMTETLLHFAARRQHLVETVWPALESGTWVLSDRFADSTMAYQGHGHELGPGAIEMIYRLVVGEFQPDLTLILDLPVDEGLRRAEGRRDGATRYERMGRDFHERLHRGFLEIAKSAPARCVLIDARGSIDEVHAAVKAVVTRQLMVDLP